MRRTKRQSSKPPAPRKPLTKRQQAVFGNAEQPVEPQLARSYQAYLKESEDIEKSVIRSITGRLG